MGVILSGRREDALERVRQSCENARQMSATGGAVRVLAFDMGDLDSLGTQAARALAQFGRVDVVALCAGVSVGQCSTWCGRHERFSTTLRQSVIQTFVSSLRVILSSSECNVGLGRSRTFRGTACKDPPGSGQCLRCRG